MAFSVSGAACGLPLGLVWARSAIAPGCVTGGFLLQVAVCPAHAAKFIFLSSSDLPPQNYLPCRALQEEWQRQLSCPDLSCSLSFIPAGLHLLPCVKVSVEPPHGGLASRTNEKNGINTNTMWQKRNSQIRSPAWQMCGHRNTCAAWKARRSGTPATKSTQEEGAQRVLELASSVTSGSALWISSFFHGVTARPQTTERRWELPQSRNLGESRTAPFQELSAPTSVCSYCLCLAQQPELYHFLSSPAQEGGQTISR